MSDWRTGSPVAFFIFNRPGTTRRVFSAIAMARPRQLLVIADGPRRDRPEDAGACAETRRVIDQVDWDCEVVTQYADRNLGCRKRLSSGLDWVFGAVEQAIILEDDCLPHPTFFRYCDELLRKYRDDTRVAHVGGSNFQFGRSRTTDSYYFSSYHHVWGWATWRRAWRYYDVDLTRWRELRDGGWLSSVFPEPKQRKYWRRILDRVATGKIDTWDYQWELACWLQGGLSTIPDVNLVSNIGFGQDSTHTRAGSPLADMPQQPMAFPIKHPAAVKRNLEADAFTSRHIYKPFIARVLDKARYDPQGLLRQAGRAGTAALSHQRRGGGSRDD
jgi:hypothetical protein